MQFHHFVIVGILLFNLSQTGMAQSTCCSPTTEFAALSKGVDFQKAHQMPAPEPDDSGAGVRTTIPVPDGKPANVHVFTATGTPKATILVIHEWWGMNRHVITSAERLFTELDGQVNVVAVDLYDGLVATTREEAAKAMQECSEVRARAILSAVINAQGDTPIATVGWCFGGGWSLQASILAGEKAAACVIYYGMPEKDTNVLKTLYAPVLGIFASKDQWITPQLVETFEAEMTKLEKTITVRMYDADHAFANPSNAQFDREATADAWTTTVDFFRVHLLDK